MHREDSTQRTSRRFVSAVLAFALCVLQPVAAAQIDQQRELFKSVYETVERGDWSPSTVFLLLIRRSCNSTCFGPTSEPRGCELT